MQEPQTGSPDVQTSDTQKGGFNPLFGVLGIGALAGILMAVFTIIGPQTNGSPAPINGAADQTPVPDTVRVDQPAPDFTGISSTGEEVTLSALQGRVVAINFWATWCGPCRVEMPALQAASEQYSEDEFVLLAVNAGESQQQVSRFMDDLGLTFIAIVDREEVIVDQYLVRVFPTTVWVDENGIVFAEHFGPLSEDLIQRYLDELLA